MGRKVVRGLALLFVLVGCSESQLNLGDAGSGMDAGLMDTGLDARPEPTATWTATKTTLDVWWSTEESGFRYDPGRDTLKIYTLMRTTGACDDEASETVVKVCGIDFPTYTNDVYCDAYQLTISDSAWDSASMPSFTAHENTPGDTDAGAVAAKIANVLVGIDIGDDTRGQRWT